MNYLPTRVEAELPGRDGERQSLGFTLSVLKEKDGRVGICAFFKDLTHVEMTEESENLKQRLLMLGQMAAGLAHEIRNPIASIGVHASILRSHLSGNEKLLSSVAMMSREIEKVEYIIRECLNFVRPAELGIRQVQVDALLDGVVARMITLHPGMKFSIQKPANGGLKVDADAALLEQVLTNILANAAEACHGIGIVNVFVGTSRHFTESVRLNRQVEKAPSRQFGEGGGVYPDPHPRQWARHPSGNTGSDLRTFFHHEKNRVRDRSPAGPEDCACARGRPRHEQRSRKRDRIHHQDPDEAKRWPIES